MHYDPSELSQFFARCIYLLKQLITLHPVYGASTQRAAVALIAQFMREAGWDMVEELAYQSKQLALLPGYVDVEALGPPFASDTMIDKWNVLAVANSLLPGPTLIVNGHYDVDVVTAADRWRKPEFWRSAYEDCGRIYGRGATDMLGGLCAALAATSFLLRYRTYWRGRIIFMAVTDEEVGGNGTLHGLKWLSDSRLLSRETASSTECIIPEPSEGRACNESLGFIQCRIIAHGRASHMGNVFTEQNAYIVGHRALLNMETAVDALAQELDIKDSRQSFVINFGRIEAGEDPSVTPARFVADGVLFFPNTVQRSDLKAALTRQFSLFGPAAAELSYGNFGLDGARFAKGRLHQVVSNHGGHYIRIDDELFRSPCDARLFEPYGIQTIICGPGRLEQAHSIDEYIQVHELAEYFREFVHLAERYLNPSDQ